MGRPRKTPRRIVSFNLEQTTADRIDALNLSNRSEWANTALKEVMDFRLDQRKGQHLEEIENARERATEEAQEALLEELSQNPHRLSAMLFGSLQRSGFDQTKIKGRYTLAEQLRKAINDGTFRGD